MEDDEKIDDPSAGTAAFVLAFAAAIEKKLTAQLANESSRRPAVLTDIALTAGFQTAADLILSNPPYPPPWPANEPLPIELSAHGNRQWLIEKIEKMPDAEHLKVTPCQGPSLDLQVRQGGRVIFNIESELGGNRQRAEDMDKLTRHTETPLASVMMVREKSAKHLEGTLKTLKEQSADRAEPFINVAYHWPNNTPLSSAKVIVTVTQGGDDFIGDQLDDDDSDVEDDELQELTDRGDEAGDLSDQTEEDDLADIDLTDEEPS